MDRDGIRRPGLALPKLYYWYKIQYSISIDGGFTFAGNHATMISQTAKGGGDMNIKLAENIRSSRKARGLTQEQLAEVLGVTVGAVHKWETRLSVPELPLIV